MVFAIIHGMMGSVVGVIGFVIIKGMIDGIDTTKMGKTEQTLIGIMPIIFAVVIVIGVIGTLTNFTSDSTEKKPSKVRSTIAQSPISIPIMSGSNRIRQQMAQLPTIQRGPKVRLVAAYADTLPELSRHGLLPKVCRGAI